MPTPQMILIEGIPGSGKTTTARFIQHWLERRGFAAQLHLEGDLDHPADYESVACLSVGEYARLFDAYPEQHALLEEHTFARGGNVFAPYRKMRAAASDMPPALLDELARREIYELPDERFRQVASERWIEFAARVQHEQRAYIFECCFLQNPLTTLLARHNLPPETAARYVLDLSRRIAHLHPVVIYLDPADIRQTLEAAAQDRPKEWLDYVIQYITGQAWGAARGLSGFDGMVRFYQERRDLERRIFDQMDWKKLWLHGAEADWDQAHRQIETLLAACFLPEAGAPAAV